MKYLVEVSFTFTIKVEADSQIAAIEKAEDETTLASLDIVQSDMSEYFPSSVKVLGVLDDK